MIAQDWFSITYDALAGAWQGFIGYVPVLLGAIIIFIIGWLIALGVERLIASILVGLRFNRLFEHVHWKEALDKAEFTMNPAEFIGAIFKWIFVILFLLIAVEILGLQEFAAFLNSVMLWLPNIIVAVAMFVVAAIAADILSKITVAAIERARLAYAQLAAKIVRWSIWIFAILAIMFQLGVASPLIETLFTGLMAGLALAFGLAFGLGGRDMAAEFLAGIKRHIHK